MLKCNGEKTDKCTWCTHSQYHTKHKCKWRTDYKNFDGSKMKQVKHCDLPCKCTERNSDCEGCNFLEDGYICKLSTIQADAGCLKGKITIEDLVLIMNEILPYIFADGSNDMTNIASALMKYPRHDLSVNNFLKTKDIKNEKG